MRTVTASVQLFSQTLSKLEGWSASMPKLKPYFEPMHSWLSSKMEFDLSSPASLVTEESEDFIIDNLLLSIQSLVRLSNETESPSEDSTLPDGYIRDGATRIATVTSKLNLGNIADALDSAVEKLATSPQNEVQRCIGRFMPFLDEFMTLAEIQVQGHIGWTRSLLKLDFVLASVVRNIARDGFCQPQETEEGDGGEGGEQVEGTGLGEGTGEKNVSKEIEDESQVEGLQGEDGDNNEDVERAEEGNAVEMSEDIGGKMQDVPDEGGEDEEGEDEDGSEQDLDEQIGDLDGSEENAVDEKMWGDEEDPKDQDDSSKEPGKDDTTQSNKESQMAAKTDDQNQSSESKQDKQDQDVPPDAQPEEEEAEAVGEEEAPEEAGAEGAPIDEHLKNSEILDLPDDLDIDMDKDQQDMKLDDDLDEEMGDEDEQPGDDSVPQDSGDQPDEEMDIDAEHDEPSKAEDTLDANAEPPEQEDPQDNQQDSAVAQADIHSGDGTGDSNVATADATNDKLQESQQSEGASRGQSGQIAGPSEQGEQEKEEQAGEEYVMIKSLFVLSIPLMINLTVPLDRPSKCSSHKTDLSSKLMIPLQPVLRGV